MSRLFIYLTLCAAAVLPQSPVVAQPGPMRVEGDVLRSSSGDPVRGANVILVGTLHGTVTDQAGHFSLGVVRPGSYVLRVSMTGLTPVDRALSVPDDLREPLIIVLREARVDLAHEPLAATAESFRALIALPSHGDPYFADASVRVLRIAGARQRRFAAPYAGTLVRGLAGDRSGTGSAGASDGLLQLPGVGTLDFASIVESGAESFIGLDPVPGATAGASFVGLSRDHRGSTHGSPDRVRGDLGYQSNLNAFSSGITATGASTRMRTAATARYTAGRDFASASDEVWEGSFRQGGVVARAEVSPTRRSIVSVSGRAVRIGSADLPGAGVEMDRARNTGLSAGWTTSPEGSVVRRTDISVAWSRSGADLSNRLAPQDWSRMDVDQSRLSASAAVDLHTGPLDRLQTGVTLSSLEYEWRGAPTAENSAVPGDVYIDAGRVLVSPFLFAELGEERVELSLAARLDAAGTRHGTGGQGASSGTSWRSSPAAAAAVSYRPDRHWVVSLTVSTLSLEPALAAVSSARIPTPIRLPDAPVSGNPDLKPERLFFVGTRVTRTRAPQVVSLAAFVTSINRYVTPSVDDTGQYSYTSADAILAGFEMSASRELMPFVRGSGFLAFAWGRNRTISEPLPLIYPLNGRIDLTASAARGRLLFEVSTEFALRQNRVATSLAERRSDGYAAFHLWLGIPVTRHFGLRTGVYNMFNAHFAPHENVLVRDRDARLPAPGRSWTVSGRFRY